MSVLKKAIALVTAAVMMICCSMTAGAVSRKYDYNMDSGGDSADLRTLNDYLLGRGTLDQAAYNEGDLNGDGKVNVFDLILMREYSEKYSGKAPSGMWIATGYSGTRFFWFNGQSGLFCPANVGVSTDFTFTQSGSSMSFALKTGGSLSAKIRWIDDKHFELNWGGDKVEKFTYYCNYKIDTTTHLDGKYATSGSYGERWFVINKLTGTQRVAYGKDLTGFTYIFDSAKMVFIYNDGTIKKCGFKRIDRDHFVLTWPDGTVEKFTRRQVEIKNGITYINGILIANKTYSLPSSYDPGGLTAETSAAYNEMKAAAAAAGVSMWITSGYRSYSYQSQLYNYYCSVDGQAIADTYSARPGYSEHQSGMALDINYADSSFTGSPTALWLEKNSWKYGFILRYPAGKESITGYKYESWHFRYIGKENAKLVYNSGLTLEEYLQIDSKYS